MSSLSSASSSSTSTSSSSVDNSQASGTSSEKKSLILTQEAKAPFIPPKSRSFIDFNDLDSVGDKLTLSTEVFQASSECDTMDILNADGKVLTFIHPGPLLVNAPAKQFEGQRKPNVLLRISEGLASRVQELEDMIYCVWLTNSREKHEQVMVSNMNSSVEKYYEIFSWKVKMAPAVLKTLEVQLSSVTKGVCLFNVELRPTFYKVVKGNNITLGISWTLGKFTIKLGGSAGSDSDPTPEEAKRSNEITKNKLDDRTVLAFLKPDTITAPATIPTASSSSSSSSSVALPLITLKRKNSSVLLTKRNNKQTKTKETRASEEDNNNDEA